ncbi:hypothetical protein AN189_05315 [Loktanella sp. 3ANDIMAR09]|uniref:hypothetical protein n=1 Tax=Loktanella sp. 3ANDIMAR09 TaxID=1225657 RepID=UPI0006F4D087|nr:hypothetical protein [Loktanella sp. 3ANDIMAR09]KQI69015.1 hypothetical protein AN189_05315 [Loktanella sp. 3ANDIMAR09]
MQNLKTVTLCAAIIGAGPAVGQIVDTSENGEWRTIESETVLEIPDWPEVRDRVVALWGPDDLVEIPLSPDNILGVPDLPETYTSSVDGVEVVHLEGAPDDPQALVFLAQLFPDIGAEDLTDFQDGVRMETINLYADRYEVTVLFLDRVDDVTEPAAPATAPGTLGDALESAMRDTGALDDDLPGFSMSNPFIFVELPITQVTPLVQDVIAGRGIDVTATEIPGSGTQFMGVSAGGATLVNVSAVEDGVTMITLVSQPEG